MTEEEWYSNGSPMAMLEYLSSRASSRKLRLFAFVCCIQNWDLFKEPAQHEGLLLFERSADADIPDEVYTAAETRLRDAEEKLVDDDEFALLIPLWLTVKKFNAEDARSCASSMAYGPSYREGGFDGLENELLFEQAAFLRDIFGNPFRPVAFDSRWRTSDVVGLARAIYDEKAFERMPILADALMDAGCEDEEIMSHCRGDGPHVRGCWVVDLILDKQ